MGNVIGTRGETALRHVTCWGYGLWRAALGLTCMAAACTAEGGVVRARAALELPGGEVDCAPVMEALLRIRTPAEQTQADAMAAQLAVSSPHDDIPVTELVSFVTPSVEDGLPLEAGMQGDVKRVAAWILCDKLTREVVTRSYLAAHPEHRR